MKRKLFENNIEYDNKIRELKKIQKRKAETARERIYNDERRELAVEMINKGFDNIPICDKKSIADSIGDLVKKFNKSRKPHTKNIPLFNSKFEVLS